MRGGRRNVSVIILMAALAGCDASPTVEALNPSSSASFVAVERIQAGEKLKVTVFGEDKLSGNYDVDPAGMISLPLAGTVQAAGRTKIELERILADKFKGEYLKSPRVTVDIAAFRPFYVLGEVQKPGEYPFKSGLNVMSAIAVAGGQTYRASTSKVLVQRSGETVSREYPLTSAVPIYPGDLIRLPERYF